MSVKVSAWVWSTTQDNPVDRLVLLAIADCADDNGGNAFPSMTTVARKACITRRGAQLAVRRLVESGLLTIIVGRGQGRCNLYQIVMGSEPGSHQTPGKGERGSLPKGEPGSQVKDVRGEPGSPSSANQVQGICEPDDTFNANARSPRTSLEPSWNKELTAPSATDRPISEPGSPPYFDRYTPDVVVPASAEVRDAAIAETRRIRLDQQRNKANRISG